MHYKRLTEVGIGEGLIVPGGATPEASLYSAVSQEIKKREAAGDPQRFRTHGKGYFSLAQPSDPLYGAIEEKNQEVKTRLRELLSELHPELFEHLIGELLVALGFDDVVVTRYVADKGIDIRATLVVGGITDVKTAIQVKRNTTSNVSRRTVQQLRGGLEPHERGLLVTLSGFTKQARDEASEVTRSPISLIDGDELLDLLMENQVGITRKQIPVFELDEGFFTESVDDESPELEEGDSASRQQPLSPPTSERALRLWPLPGGKTAWKDTLDRMLPHVEATAPSMNEAISWLISQFDSVNSLGVARGYWSVLKSFGLIETQGEQVTVTALGREYLDDPTPDRLLTIATQQILGMEEMLGWLGENPHTMEDLLIRFNRTMGVKWETTAQIEFRLGWLAVVGAVDQAKGGWFLR